MSSTMVGRERASLGSISLTMQELGGRAKRVTPIESVIESQVSDHAGLYSDSPQLEGNSAALCVSATFAFSTRFSFVSGVRTLITISMTENEISKIIIGCAIEVHSDR